MACRQEAAASTALSSIQDSTSISANKRTDDTTINAIEGGRRASLGTATPYKDYNNTQSGFIYTPNDEQADASSQERPTLTPLTSPQTDTLDIKQPIGTPSPLPSTKRTPYAPGFEHKSSTPKGQNGDMAYIGGQFDYGAAAVANPPAHLDI